MRALVLSALVAEAIALPARAQAQAPPAGSAPQATIEIAARLPVAPGARVNLRVRRAPDPMYPRIEFVGRVTGVGSDAISLIEFRDTMTFAWRDVRSLDVSVRREARLVTARHRAARWALIGIAAGALIGAASYEGPDDFFCGSRGACATGGAVLLGVPGLVLGAVAGLVSPYERWRRVLPAARARAGLAPGARGLMLSLRR